jgi:hypothetical protein
MRLSFLRLLLEWRLDELLRETRRWGSGGAIVWAGVSRPRDG